MDGVDSAPDKCIDPVLTILFGHGESVFSKKLSGAFFHLYGERAKSLIERHPIRNTKAIDIEDRHRGA